MSDDLKGKALKGLKWSSLDRVVQQTIQTVLGILMLNLLLPETYGVIAMLAIFNVIAAVLLDSGFSQALIRIKHPTPAHYSSIFYLNISISILVYVILFFSAPLIASFYDIPELTNISRVLFLTFIINASGSIQNTILVKEVQFKYLAKINFISLCISGLTGLYLAYLGYSVWALVFQSISLSLSKVMLLWLYSDWRPKKIFSLTLIKEMFSFGSKILLQGIVSQITGSLYSLIIGKYYDATQAGYYSQAQRYSMTPAEIVQAPISSVAYPILNQLEKNDIERQRRAFRKFLKIMAFIAFPSILGMAFIADEFFTLLVPKKEWIFITPYLKILCLNSLLYPINTLSIQMLMTHGKSQKILNIEILRCISCLLMILLTINHGIIFSLWGTCIINLSFALWNTAVASKIIQYKLKDFCLDVIPFLALTIFSLFCTYYITLGIDHLWLKFALKILVCMAIYFFMLKILKAKIIEEAEELFRNKIKHI